MMMLSQPAYFSSTPQCAPKVPGGHRVRRGTKEGKIVVIERPPAGRRARPGQRPVATMILLASSKHFVLAGTSSQSTL